jgi:hypothetical protein
VTGPPKSTGKPPEDVVLEGKLVPFGSDGQPVFLRITGSSALYLPCFSEKKSLQEVMGRAGAAFEKIQKVVDSVDFLRSIPMKDPTGEALHVVIDPRFTPEGKVRFKQLYRD